MFLFLQDSTVLGKTNDAGHGTIVLNLAINVNKLSSHVPLIIMQCHMQLSSEFRSCHWKIIISNNLLFNSTRIKVKVYNHDSILVRTAF